MWLRNYLKSRSSTLNPYYYAGSMVLSRLAWDIRYESWLSREKIRAWKNSHQGEKAVIVCNGPSLLKSDLSLLDNVFTFGLNKINLLFDRSEFRPSCIVAVNPFVIEQNKDFYSSTSIPLFLDRVALGSVQSHESRVFLHSTQLSGFAKDCSMSVYQGYTVTYVAMQLAYFFGFKKVALIGADHSFGVKGPGGKTVVSGKVDKSHFDEKYFSGGAKWQLPDLAGSERSYLMAREAYEEDGRILANASEGGELEIFRRISLEDFVSD